ncbi:hypothetical protein HU200_006973 [Digitaria exilis]|uniref:TFIIS N-terminal domain-containing protein n=1 Tax=Digitaria exilis TaxID=1010633 RepID=A0A835FP76_9POAL|nr:hypothetical protein HU200_006973 [Digitaria exilis]
MLEDFFTLTEMKDGISTVARITELISEMHKLENAAEINTPDLIRQCSTAANTLASTKNQECLQHFVQLNGVGFLNRWLKDAQNCAGDVSTSAEDLIAALLTALDCLPINSEQSTSCGVVSTVNHLLAHGNAVINQKATALCQKWSSLPKYGERLETEEACQADQKSPEVSPKTEIDKQSVANKVGDPTNATKPDVVTCSDAPLSDPSQTNDNTEATKQPPGLTSPNLSNGNTPLGDVKNSVTSPTSACHVGLEDGQSNTKETSASNDVNLSANGVLPSNSINAKSGTGQDATLDASPAAMFVEPNKPGKLFVSSEMDLGDNVVSTSSSIKESEPFAAARLNLEKDTSDTLNHLASVTRDLQDLSEESTGKEEGPTSSSSTDDIGMGSEYILKRCMNSFGDSSKATDTKLTALKGEKSTRLTDYDDTDALEVARLVAIEVEREVIDYRGPFCGSPDINSRNADSPDLEGRRQPVPVDELNDNKSSSTGADSGSSSSLKEDGSGITDGSGPLSRKHTRSVELGNLDLNENQCAEEADCNPKSILSTSVNLSMPIAVAASRGSSVFPARLHFEGELGWKGSAATSAFRPASLRRTPDAEKSLSAASSHKTSNVLFDLNVADSDSATSGEPLSTAILPASSDLASKGASTAAGASGGLKLDLNFSCGDDEDAVTASNVPPLWNRPQFNGNWSQPSSSSSSRQPAVRNFDLNDNMSVTDGSGRGIDGSSVKTPARDMSDHSAVTIMGKRIIVGQKEHEHQYQHNFMGPSVESRVPARSIQSFAHTSDYSGVSYPSQPAMPFPQAFFAPGGVPYMVDAKGAPVIQPLSGLSLGISHPSFSTRATPPSSNELSYYHPSMDFNYGVPSEGARREAGSYWPVSYQGQTIFMDERTRNMSQGGSSGLVMKRKEPESGWDMFSRR